MARLHINLPEKFLFSTDIAVRISDLNYGGHVGNDTMLTLLQEARMQFYRSLGFKDETSFEGTVGQIIIDAAVQYKAESFLGDVLVIKIAADDFTKFGFDLLYEVKNKSTGQEIARAKTGIVCFDYQKRKMTWVPEALASNLQPT
ncbi:MAG TPA: thioesterase family protein [Chryseolinea sp.]|nr:thioesterase family protein [Chryseolinea sp.]